MAGRAGYPEAVNVIVMEKRDYFPFVKCRFKHKPIWFRWMGLSSGFAGSLSSRR
jgi:hypothetical protein